MLTSGMPVVAAATSAAHHPMAIRVAALPSDRLHFGLSNLDSAWMTSSGVPWRYRFQYLSAGVNTGSGWETWQDPAKPPGQFALDYMTSSTAPPANYIPVFTYYELLQSTPSTGSSELQRDFNNLNNAATMNAYYANFKLLMQRAGAYGSQVVIHVEPDFWGYMQQVAAGGGATAVTAKVKSSNFPEASAFNDDLAGFAAELKFLRDTYAPSALLAMHASMWSSGIDIASNTDPSVNAAGEADKTAVFLNSAGAGSWDAVFNDVDDHNAAWWELASCGTPPCVNQSFTHWWDPTNVKFPNFNRYLGWVGELHAQTGRPQIVWQVPMGNQYFLTMNNTCGHYQDNVAPYFIAHASQLFNAGLVAVLFGAGNSCQTTNDDSQKDGITNNNGIATTDQLGGCSACNTHASSVSDDDGGYLRTFVGQYYATPVCATAGLAPSSISQAAGSTVNLTASSTGCSSPRYAFWVQDPSGNWSLQQGFGGPAFNWNTTGLAPGTYVVHVWANSQGNGYDAIGSATVTLTGCASASLSPANPTQAAGSTVNFTASSSGCLIPRYAFWVQYPGGAWYFVRDFGGPSFNWSTAGLAPGTYTVHVWVNAARNGHDAVGSSTVTLTISVCASAALSPPNPTQAAGTTVSFTASSSGCPNPRYAFWVQYPDMSWHFVRDFGAPTFNWSTAGLIPGAYTVHVWVNTQGNSYDSVGSATVTLTGCTAAALAPATVTQVTPGTINFTASSATCSNPRYEFWIQYPNTTWHWIRDFGGPTFAYSTAGLGPGTYTVHVWVNTQGTGYDSVGSSTVTLS